VTPDEAITFIHERSGYDRGFISNPFAGDEAARRGLQRTEAVLARLDNPERSCPLVHVAGSKGKGSTSTFIDSIMRAAGNRTGRFLSPHMHSFRERFVVDDEPIPEQHFARLVATVRAAVLEAEDHAPDLGQVTAWELSTALAFAWFAETRCDVAVVEVGMGGTLDATNVIDPAVSLITRLDYEHTAILGDTMEEIAGNKAGIIKPARPVLTVEQPEEAMAVIASRAAACGAPLFVAQRDWLVSGTWESFSVRGPDWSHDRLGSSLIGQHQMENAGLAVAAVHALASVVKLPNPITDSAVRNGLATAFIPGRFEVVGVNGHEIVLDGAHTPVAASALSAAIESRFPGQRALVIAGMLTDKEPGPVLAPLHNVAASWIAVPLASPRSHDPAVIVAAVQGFGGSVSTTTSVPEALELTLANPEPGLVVVTGSLATVAEARVALHLS